MSRVVEVTATLAAPVAAKGALNLDAIVLHGIASQVPYRYRYDTPPDCPLVELRQPSDRFGVYASSDASYALEPPWHGIYPIADYTKQVDYKPRRELTGMTGKRLDCVVTPRVRWLCAVHGKDRLLEVLHGIKSIGRNRAGGYGKVHSWDVRYYDAFGLESRDCVVYKCRTLRSVPVAWSQSVLECELLPVRPPYWSYKHHVGAVKAGKPFILSPHVKEEPHG